jgi:dipeptidyl aminopeptidase/acylaminoacyl peptidase
MPWDGTELYLGDMRKAGKSFVLEKITKVAGGEDIAVFQPQFSPDGRYLAYVADPDGWWHLYLYDLKSGEHTVYTGGNAEHAVPAWVQGLRTYDFAPDGRSLYLLRNKDGFISLWQLDLETRLKERVPVGSDYTWLTQIAAAPTGNRVAVIASGGRVSNRVIAYEAGSGSRVVRRSLPEDLPSQIYSLPKAISWYGMDNAEVYGLFYTPHSETYTGIGKPPLVILVHGGPTGQRGAAFDSQVQFFTTRGWAVLQVNYRGSTGYGRAYRDRLKGSWGIYDVQDAVSGVDYLVEEGHVDGNRLVIMGGSAGGFTVLKALEDYPGKFKAGVCLYGVANQFALVADTHKFEARYSESILGKLPEAAEIYRERSPVFFADRIQDPIAIFQGEDDKVVPKNQSDQIVSALQQNGVPHEYHLYPGEGHGFRKTETIEKFYTALEKFLRQYVIYG